MPMIRFVSVVPSVFFPRDVYVKIGVFSLIACGYCYLQVFFMAKLTDMRQVLYVLALGAPVSLLTSAVSLNLFKGDWAWVVGISGAVWILASAGLVLNQYGRLDLELFCARHLSRLGVLGAAVLMSFYIYLAYFPTQVWVLACLILFTLVGLGTPWFVSCIRGDDIASHDETSRAQLTAVEKLV